MRHGAYPSVDLHTMMIAPELYVVKFSKVTAVSLNNDEAFC